MAPKGKKLREKFEGEKRNEPVERVIESKRKEPNEVGIFIRQKDKNLWWSSEEGMSEL